MGSLLPIAGEQAAMTYRIGSIFPTRELFLRDTILV